MVLVLGRFHIAIWWVADKFPLLHPHLHRGTHLCGQILAIAVIDKIAKGHVNSTGGPDEVRAVALMIGDTKYDIGCAGNAGVDSVLVGWSHYVDTEDMLADGFEPTYTIERPEDLLKII